MMALTDEKKTILIEHYSPILYYHKDEPFVPVKPDVYMEASALWCTQPAGKESRHDKNNWGNCTDNQSFPRKPLIPKNGISVDSSEDVEGASDPDNDGVNEFYLGHKRADGYKPYLASDEDRMLWLDNAAWKDSEEVTADSENREVNIERSVKRWTTEDTLVKAKDFYYAEVEEMETLSKLLVTIQGDTGVDIRDLIKDKYIIWYYFLYPVHQENLRGCELLVDTEDGSDLKHGNYEGDWTVVGVVVPKPGLLDWHNDNLEDPLYVAYGQRGRGLIENYVAGARDIIELKMFNGEVRSVDSHPKVFVGLGTHNNWWNPGDHDIPSVDIASTSCGGVENAAGELGERIDDLEDKVDKATTALVTVTKIGAGCGIGAIFGGWIGCAIGAAVGGIAALVEALVDSDDDDSSPLDDASSSNAGPDESPPDGSYGLVLVPPEIESGFVDAVSAAEVRPWAGSPEDHLVKRDKQIWWPGDIERMGYNGRWGVMCQIDKFDRRSGIPFPDFKKALLLELAIKDSQ